MSDSDDDYDDTVEDKVFPHPWERVFDEYIGDFMSMEDNIARNNTMQELAFMHPTQKTYTHDSSRNTVLCFDCLSVLGADEVYCRNCTQASSCECSHGCT